MPDNKKPIRLSTDKNALISDLLDAFQNLIVQSSHVLNNEIIRQFLDQVDITAGVITSTQDNLRKVSLVDKAFQVFNQSQGIRVLTTFASNLAEIIQAGQDYYVQTIGNQAKGGAVEAIINRQLGITAEGFKKGGYLDNLSNDPSVQAEMKQIIFNQVNTNAVGYNDLKETIKDFIVGTKQDPGAFYKQYERLAFDTYSEVDRLNSKLHADRLKLKHFVYNGGLVRDSRVFCINHNGKVFTVDQAEEWKKEINQFKLVPGKIKPLIKVVTGPIVEKGEEHLYVPVLHLGGIKCRHSADYISDEVAAYLLKKQGPDPAAAPGSFATEKGILENIAAIKEQKTDTFKYYLGPDGKFIPQRNTLHQKIIADYEKQATPAEGQKTFHLIGGATANGKSTLLKSGHLPLPKNAVAINPDDVKDLLPEYKQMIRDRDKLAAFYAHEESSFISKQVRVAALNADKNIVVDAIGDGGIEKLRELSVQARSRGHVFIANYVSLDTDTSLRLALERYERTGRFVAEDLILEYNKDISTILPGAIRENLFDELNLWDTNINGNPRLILSQKKGALTIFDQKLYNRFLSKAKYVRK